MKLNQEMIDRYVDIFDNEIPKVNAEVHELQLRQNKLQEEAAALKKEIAIGDRTLRVYKSRDRILLVEDKSIRVSNVLDI